jgi:uncharacterized protein involved in exopolysaccharide biosynthesis
MTEAAVTSPGKRGIPVNSVLDLIHVLRRKIPLATLLFALVMSGIVMGVYIRKPAFDSTAKLLISFEGTGISLSRAEYQLNTAQVQAVEVITSQSEILASRSLVERVIDEVGVEALRDPPPTTLIGRFVNGLASFAGSTIESALLRLGLASKLDERDILVDRLGKSLSVYPVRQSQIMLVSVRWHRPEIANLLLGKVLEVYFAINEEIGQGANGYQIFAEQTKRLSSELSDAEQALLQFRLNNNLMDLPREKQFLTARIETLSALTDGMDASFGAGPGTAGGPAANVDEDMAAISQAASLQSQLETLRVELARVRITATSDNRAVRELESQISEVEKSLVSIYARATKSLEDAKSRLRAVNEAEAGYERIRRDVEMATDAYQTYRKVAEDRRSMPSRSNQIDVQIVDSPSQPYQPLGPSRLILLIAGLPFSLLCAIGLVLLINFHRNWIDDQTQGQIVGKQAASQTGSLSK